MEIKSRLKLWKSNMQYRLKTKMADRATVSEKLKTAELCLEAVKQDGMILRLVPRKFKTRELCIEAIKQSGKALAYVPEKFKTVELCTIALNRCDLSYKYISKRLKRTIEKLAKIGHRKYDEIEKYPVDMLEILAMYIYHNREFSTRSRSTYGMLLENILSERVVKLNKVFDWTDENKQAFLSINDKLKESFENAYKEVLTVADELEEIIKDSNDFITNYEIEIDLAAYMKKPFSDDDNSSYEFGYVISEPASSSKRNSQINYYFCHDCYKEVLNKPPHLDKERSLWDWDEYLQDQFNIGGICYAMCLLLDSDEWSFADIVKIDSIYADVEVSHQDFVRDIK